MLYSYNRKPPKVESACSRDTSRPAMTAVWYDVDRGELQATDSYIAARVPVSVGLDEASGYVPVDALKASRKRDAGGVHLNGAAEVMPTHWDGDADAEPLATFPRAELGQFPNLPGLWPVDEPCFTVGLSAELLRRLADALGAEDAGVSVGFQSARDADGTPTGLPDPLRPMLVRPLKGAEGREAPAGGLELAEGLLMPIRVAR